MNITIWILQGILAAMFAMAGVMKTTQPKEKLEKSLPWVKDFSLPMVRFIGLSELLGAIGVVAPMLTGIMTILTPIAATGLAIVMVLASTYHLRKKEYKEIAFNGFLFAMAAIVVYYRFKTLAA